MSDEARVLLRGLGLGCAVAGVGGLLISATYSIASVILIVASIALVYLGRDKE